MAFDGQAEGEAGAPLDLELNLAVAPEQMRRLRRHPLLAAARPSRRVQATTYFDTPDLALHQRALALRVGREGRRFFQTLTGTADATRIPPVASAWRSPVPGAAPDISRLGALEPLADIDGSQLRPVFASRVSRSTRIIHPDPAGIIAVSFEEGEVKTGDGRSAPISELALELKAGPAQTLYELARALNETVPLRIETRSPAARGYGLLQGGDKVETGFGKVELTPEMPAEDAFSAILRHALWHMLAHDQAAVAGNVEAVHQMRVALRRLRATFSLFRPMIPEEQRLWADTELRWIAGALGAARNWDVLGEHLQPLEEHFAAEAAISALSRAIRASRHSAYDAVAATITLKRYTDFVLRLLTWTETRGWRQQSVSESSVHLLSPVGDLAAELLDRRYQKARKLAKQFDHLTPDERHRLRIAVKKLRYAIDSLQQLYRTKSVKRALKCLGALQDDLGIMNDITTMNGLLAELGGTGAEGDVGSGAALLRGWYGRVMREREEGLGKKLHRFLGMKAFWRPAEDD